VRPWWLLLGWVTLAAFRKRARWAWFAVLTSVGLGAAASAMRYFTLDRPVGTVTAVATLAPIGYPDRAAGSFSGIEP
jgi:hypothetical protein